MIWRCHEQVLFDEFRMRCWTLAKSWYRSTCHVSLLTLVDFHLWVILAPAKAEVLTSGEKTAMSNPPIPPDIFDHIVDNLHDKPDALRNCCLVAKSWIPRTRKHLFANIEFSSPERLESWKRNFPDSSYSPAYHTRTLSVQCPQVVTMADAEEGGWIRAFSRVVRLEVSGTMHGFGESDVSLTPFHAFSPILRSLSLFSTTLPLSRIFSLVRSLPLLEDLMLAVHGIPNNDDLDVGGPPIGIPPPNSPVFTGTLRLVLFYGMGLIVRRLLDLPNGLHFRHLSFSWIREDELQWINALVAECSDTLESINTSRRMFGAIVRFLRR